MSKYSRIEYDRLKRDFELCTKKINNYETERALPTDETERAIRIDEYKTEVIATYNGLVTYIKKYFATFKPESKVQVRSKVSAYKAAVLRALTILNLQVDLPENFEKNFRHIFEGSWSIKSR